MDELDWVDLEGNYLIGRCVDECTCMVLSLWGCESNSKAHLISSSSPLPELVSDQMRSEEHALQGETIGHSFLKDSFLERKKGNFFCDKANDKLDDHGQPMLVLHPRKVLFSSMT